MAGEQERRTGRKNMRKINSKIPGVILAVMVLAGIVLAGVGAAGILVMRRH